MEEPFYSSGLHFTCQKCSCCCRISPGYVFLSLEDVLKLSSAFHITPEKFVDTYCRAIDAGGFLRLSLNEKKNYDCIFWENGGCSVYEARPLQCSSFPFWSSHLSSPEDWRTVADSCPGVNRGELHTKEEIEALLARRLSEPLL